jgi:hypothetical protein
VVINGLKPSNFKEWVWSAKVLTTIVWIIFPLGYITIIRILDIPSVGYIGSGEPKPLDLLLGPIIFHLPHELGHYINIFLIYAPPIPLMAVLFLFSVYPAICPTKKFFKRRGGSNAVIEYKYLTKILFVFLIVLILAIIALSLLISNTQEYMKNLLNQERNLVNQMNNLAEHGNNLKELQQFNYVTRGNLLKELQQFENVKQQFENVDQKFKNVTSTVNSLYVVIYVLSAVLIFILLKLLLERVRRQFGFYYSKACFEIIIKTESETDKTSYLILGLEWYNKFIKRVTMEGCDIETIFSKIVSHAQLSNNTLLDTIVESFNGEDKLKPMRHMLTLLSCWKEGGGSLTKQSLRAKIKGSSDLLIPIVTVIITIISTFFLKPPK